MTISIEFQILIPMVFLIVWLAASFSLSRLLKRNDIADVFWGLGFVGLAWSSLYTSLNGEMDRLNLDSAVRLVGLSAFNDLRSKIIFCLVTFWGLRLSIYLWTRLRSKPEEDARYMQMRVKWGPSEPVQAFLKVYLLQGALLTFIGLPMFTTLMKQSSPMAPLALSGWDFLGFSMAIIGLLFEIIADGEMMRFKAKSEPRQVLSAGLWNWSRHPNYFGEILFWWGVFFLCSSGPMGWWGIGSPLLITFLLLKVSGIPMLDQLMKSKKPNYSSYATSTPALIPFTTKDFFSFFAILTGMLALDLFWLGFVMKDFYIEQTRALLRLDSSGGYDPLLWAVAGVYVCIPLGLQFFALNPSKTAGEVIFRGGLFGFVSYGIYEFTNLSLVKDWPLEMALIDLGWGMVLCAVSVYVGFWAREGTNRSAVESAAHSAMD